MATPQSQNPPNGDLQSTGKLQILEERLKAIEGGRVNAIEETSGKNLVKKVANVKTPMKVIFRELYKFGMIQRLDEIEGTGDKETECGIHWDVEHSIEEYGEFRQILQNLMDAQLVQIGCASEEMEVNMIKESVVPQDQVCTNVQTPLSVPLVGEEAVTAPKPLVLRYAKNTPMMTSYGPKPITIQVLAPFLYKNTKAVPWRYDVQVLTSGAQSS
ncbi:hypothetical protein SESBI_14947 [Sesbania bispinosa]|nr:hypothetical protein SESBI_14947 [Sesbania bispinosa]